MRCPVAGRLRGGRLLFGGGLVRLTAFCRNSRHNCLRTATLGGGPPLFANGVRKIPNLNLHAAQQARVKGYFPRDTSFVSVLAKVRRFLSDFVRF